MNSLDCYETNLEHIYNRQLDSQIFFEQANKSGCVPNDVNLESKFKHNLLLLIKEATEVLDEINYKDHKKSKKELDKNKIAEELIDVFKFWLNLCILCNIQPAEIVSTFDNKTSKVLDKLKREFFEEKNIDVQR